MKDCCDAKAEELQKLRGSQSRVLWIVFAINLLMFAIEFGAGVWARSLALTADSLDMLGDATIYALSLYAIAKNPIWSVRAAFLKGSIMGLFGLGVLAGSIHRTLTSTLPQAEAMGAVSFLALVANLSCAMLLFRHRGDDINMRSTWLCSRNDVIANVGVLAAALGVAVTGSKWPDLVVGVAIAALVLKSSWSVIQEAMAALAQKTAR